MSGRWAVSRPTIGTVQAKGRPIPGITDILSLFSEERENKWYVSLQLIDAQALKTLWEKNKPCINDKICAGNYYMSELILSYKYMYNQQYYYAYF
jgi:hypothetical protein